MLCHPLAMRVELDDYLSIAEQAAPPEPDALTFCTGLTNSHELENRIHVPCRECGIEHYNMVWGLNGAMVRFDCDDDLFLFSMAYQSQREEVLA